MKNKRELKVGDPVTISVSEHAPPGVYTVSSTHDPDSVLLTHPFMCDLLMPFPRDQIDLIAPPVMGSIERGLFYCLHHRKFLDYTTIQHIKAIALHFSRIRRLTHAQKYEVAQVCGTIARIYLNDDLGAAISLVVENKGVLDEFNMTWYNNFKKHFEGSEPIRKKSQRVSIFNIAGFVRSELAPISTYQGGPFE